ncbi:MAG: hypothetical protein BMS9Abin05_1563 [Rhodothermia bacterium]|nr:MAG: hypothetical protein BMS9Abin05_1563 [Rhodothermia bacterium]
MNQSLIIRIRFSFVKGRGVAILLVMFLAIRPVAAQIDPPDLWESVLVPALEPLQNGDAAWGDYDGDGDLDLFYTGNTGTFDDPTPFTQFYFNDGDYLELIPDPSAPDANIEVPATRYAGGLNVNLPILEDIWRSAVAWGDYDNDDRLDVVATGITSSGQRGMWIYRNVPIEERFLRVVQLPGLSDGDIAWADYDNDGDLDLALSGIDDAGTPQSWLFENQVRDGGTFVQSSAGIIGLDKSSLAWGDYDNDRDMDLLLTGVASPQRFVTILYRNDGSGNFSQDPVELDNLYAGSVAWGDGDADGDLDILLSGAELNPFLLEGKIAIYENSGGSFSSSNVTVLGGFEGDPALGRYAGAAAWGDFNNDGFADFIINGLRRPLDTDGGQTYESRGNQTYVKSTIGFRHGAFSGATNGPSFWGDYDNDGDLDLFVMGREASGNDIVTTKRNYLPFYPPNSIPNPPGSLSSTVQGNGVEMSWAEGNDGFSPAASLTYNIRVGTEQGIGDIVTPMSRSSDGQRLISEMGNTQHNRGWILRNLPPGTYYWSVQTIDTSFKGSQFAVEESFTITE